MTDTHMTEAHTLTRHRDIQNWVSDRKGMPALVQAHNRLGELRSHLAIKFAGTGKPRGMPAVDQGVTPVSWVAWLAELDRQQLALRVSPDDTYELIERKSLN
jgi:hypothetical protein